MERSEKPTEKSDKPTDKAEKPQETRTPDGNRAEPKAENRVPAPVP